MTSAVRVRNPWTGACDYSFTPDTAAAVATAADRLRAAQPAWAAAGVAGRAATLRQWRDALAARRSELYDALSEDTGRCLLAATEIDGVLAAIDRWCDAAPDLLAEPEGQSARMPSVAFRWQYVPYPVVGVISPWNFPLTLSLIDAIPALIAGCTVLLKPSEVTPRFAEPLAASIADVPDLTDLVAVVRGPGDVGQALIDQVDAICFTGSVATGRKVAAQAAANFIPAFLELGGKDPAIVTASADLEAATTALLRASVAATGQACQSLERLYVDATIFDAFVDRLVEKAEQVTINWPDKHAGQLGPLIFHRQADTIAGHIADAVAKGATVHTGGEVEEHGGTWLRPTVLTGVTHHMAVMTEETFGPVLPVMAFDTVDQAIALANDTQFGLSAAVWAGTLEEAETIARRIDAGAVSLNDGALTSLINEAEKHAFKLSGLGGSRMGPAGLMRFVRKKALMAQSGTPVPLAAFDEANLTVEA